MRRILDTRITKLDKVELEGYINNICAQITTILDAERFLTKELRALADNFERQEVEVDREYLFYLRLNLNKYYSVLWFLVQELMPASKRKKYIETLGEQYHPTIESQLQELMEEELC